MHCRIRVLLVDDESFVRRMIKLYLENNGIEVLDAGSGEEALRLLESEDASIDLVLTDMLMPGISGRELAVLILKSRPDMPVVFMSGYPDQVADESDGIECLAKPLDLKRLLETISRISARSLRERSRNALNF